MFIVEIISQMFKVDLITAGFHRLSLIKPLGKTEATNSTVVYVGSPLGNVRPSFLAITRMLEGAAVHSSSCMLQGT